MGRIAGVAAADTRERLLRAAAGVFADRGYDGTRVADIATAAGVSNGAMYAHFGSKAELLVDALRTHGRRLLADMFTADPDRSITDLLLAVGQTLLRPGRYLIVEALVAARRDRDVARQMRDYMGERADWLAVLMRAAQADGEIDPAISPDALEHFCLLLSMGSALVLSGPAPGRRRGMGNGPGQGRFGAGSRGGRGQPPTDTTATAHTGAEQ